jgi:8-oxo-dGTP diphosphatase
MSKEYVAGALFSEDLKAVALIHKNRPDWQANKINLIGGKIEILPNVESILMETALEAMTREFLEETGIYNDSWKKFCYLHDDIFNKTFGVHYFYAISDDVYKIESKTDELVAVYPTDKLPKNVVPNLKWLIPMALTIIKGEETIAKFDVEEICLN